MNYLSLAIKQSAKSFKAGEFPAGAVLVTNDGKVYESDPSLPWYHGECMVIDKAIKAEGAPLTNSIIYSSMEPCLMCSGKMYWAGITKVVYAIPKDKVNASYAYEDNVPMQVHTKNFHEPIESINDKMLFSEAIKIYNMWVDKIESSK